MGNKNTNDPLPATDGISARCPRRRFLLAGVAGAGVVVLVLFFFRDWLTQFWSGEQDRGARLSPGVLADYIPEDSEALLAVNVRSLLESPVGRQHLAPSLQQFLSQAGQQLQWIPLSGISPINDLDTILISFSPGIGDRPLWLLRGRFDRSRLQLGPDKLRESNVDHFRVWNYTDRSTKQTTLLVLLSDMLVVSETRKRVLAALQQANDPRPVAVRDATLGKVLSKVDRRQTVWLAASIRSLGPLDEIKNFSFLRSILRHVHSVYGGITCADDVVVEFHFEAETDDEAVHLETALRSLRELVAVPGAASLLGLPKELLPLLRLLAASTIRREGRTILLRGRLAADQWEG